MVQAGVFLHAAGQKVENSIPQPVTGKGAIHIVGLVGHPAITEVFGAEHQHPQVAILIILENSQGGKGFD